MPRFVDIDLAALPPPDAVKLPDFNQLLADRKAEVVARVRAIDPILADDIAAILTLESEPMTKVEEAGAYREMVGIQRVNDAVRAVLLPSSAGADLDQMCSRLGVERLTEDGDESADPPVPAFRETDEALRQRYQLALEAFSTAGPYGAYFFHALSAHPHVKDCQVYGPEEDFVDLGHVHVVVLSRIGNGDPTQAILDSVLSHLSDEDVRPLNDFVNVEAAAITEYAIAYHLEIPSGPDPSMIVAAAEDALTAYAASRHKVAAKVADSGLDAAAHQVGVERAVRTSPANEIDPGLRGAAYCTGVAVTYEIVDA